MEEFCVKITLSIPMCICSMLPVKITLNQQLGHLLPRSSLYTSIIVPSSVMSPNQLLSTIFNITLQLIAMRLIQLDRSLCTPLLIVGSTLFCQQSWATNIIKARFHTPHIFKFRIAPCHIWSYSRITIKKYIDQLKFSLISGVPGLLN